MAVCTKTISPAQIEALHQKLLPLAKKQSQPANTLWQIKTEDLNVCAYKSGKVVFSGADISWLEDEKPAASSSAATSSPASSWKQAVPQAGSDEVGFGDFLGPVIVAAVLVPDEKTRQELLAMGVTDSKAMTDERIRQIAPRIEQLVPHTILVVDNPKYNRIYDSETMNMNKIKATMHNQAYLNLQAKAGSLPELKVIDQFCAPNTYYRYLVGQKQVERGITFQTKAESDFIAVAAASVLARARFLNVWKDLEAFYDMSLHKGGGALATQSGKDFVKKYGKERLGEIAKLNFRNTQKL